MSPAAGGAAPTQQAAIPVQESGRAAQLPSQENSLDPAAVQEGADPVNAATRKTAWNVPPPAPAAAAPGGIIGGEESWPALADSTRGWPRSASSDSLSLSDGSASAPSAPEDLIVPLLPVSTNPVSPGANPTFALPPSNASSVTPSRQSGGTNGPTLVGHGGGNGSRELDGSRGNVNNGSRSSSKNSSSDDNTNSTGNGNRNNGVLGGGRSGYNNNRNNGGYVNENDRRASINGNSRGGGSNSFTGSSEVSNRNGGAGGSHWSNNARNGNGSNNGFGSRGSRNRRDHERDGSFSARNYPRFSQVPPQQQQQFGMYQSGSFQGPLPPPPPGHFMVPPAFMPYVSPFAYPADAQDYPFYMTIDQQFQNMHLVQQPMHPLSVHQDQKGLQEDIQKQIEFYFSTNNLCHDTYLREHMNEQGWVPIDLLLKFPMMVKFIILGLDSNYILDAIRGSEILEVQGNNVRRRNDWAKWLLH